MKCFKLFNNVFLEEFDMKNVFCLICAIIVTGSSLFAADSIWDGDANDINWSSAANWAGDTLPPAGNRIIITPSAVADVIFDVPSYGANKFIVGSPTTTRPGTTLTFPGGTLTNPSYFIVGNGSGFLGTLYVTGAAASITSRDLNLGSGGGAGYAYISAGIVTLTGTAAGTGLAVPFDVGSYGELHISGTGKVAAARLVMFAYGFIDISGDGLLQLTGDVRTAVNALIATNNITVDSGANAPLVIYEGGNTVIVSPNNGAYLVKARNPYPALAAFVPKPEVTLTWTAGSSATKHNVYMGVTADTMTLVGDQITANSLFVGDLGFGKQYFWRVDEMDENNLWPGDVWNFTTRGTLYVEEYELHADSAAFEALWSADGGAAVTLNTAAPVLGTKSMKLDYNNAVAPYYSQASLSAIWHNDFTAFDIKAIDVSYYGNTANAAEKMYLTLTDGVNIATVQNTSSLTQTASWQVWRIALTDFTDVNPSLNMSNITGLTIGLGTKASPAAGGAGTVYIDNIRLWEIRCLSQPSADLDGDCIIGLGDFAVLASQWLANGIFPN